MDSRVKMISAAMLAVALFAGSADAQTKTKKKKADKPTAAKVMKEMDADVPAIGGTGVPMGYFGRTDKPAQMLSEAKYLRVETGWDITTGPAHILWNPKDVATGDYTVTVTFDQLVKPAHPEGFGLFIGGTDLTGVNQSYLYFLVRGTGEMFAQTRVGDKTTGRIAWQKSYGVPGEDTMGKGRYQLAIRVAGDSVVFLSNSRRVAVLQKKDMPTNGIYGLRINHNLHVHATPPSITRP